jgi:hypothetical protein
MTKIANKAKCNIIEAGNMNSGSFLGDLLVCPTYEEIINTDKFNVSGTYENNQLVKESDITKYTGKIKNYSYIWGEWDLTTKSGQIPMNYTFLNLRIRQNFLNAPDTNLKITISLRLTYRNNTSIDAFAPLNKTLTVNFTQATSADKKYAYSQDFAVTFGNSSSAQLGSVTITSVSIEPTGGTSKYEYVTNIKDVTQNYFIDVFSVASTNFLINSYNDDITNKTITSQCKISPKFTIPTGTSINNIDVYIDNQDFNYTIGESNSTNYDTSFNTINYIFTARDIYGERGYKLPYFYTKFTLKQKGTSYLSYVHALWNPASTNTGIELTSLILEE